MTNGTTTYTIIKHGDAVSGHTLADAAIELLQYDGREYEIRLEDGVFTLWVTKRSVNSYGGSGGLVPSVIHSVADDLEAAEAEIYTKVIASGHWERDAIQVVTDAAYVEMMAELEVGE